MAQIYAAASPGSDIRANARAVFLSTRGVLVQQSVGAPAKDAVQLAIRHGLPPPGMREGHTAGRLGASLRALSFKGVTPFTTDDARFGRAIRVKGVAAPLRPEAGRQGPPARGARSASTQAVLQRISQGATSQYEGALASRAFGLECRATTP